MYAARQMVLVLCACAIVGFSGCAEWHHDGDSPAAVQPGERWVRTELYCGMSRRDGSQVTDQQWQMFLDRYVTPRFPTGFTVLAASGQYQSMEDGRIYREPSRVLVILYPKQYQTDAQRKLEQISRDYIGIFEQESVLKVENDASVRFIERPAPAASQPK